MPNVLALLWRGIQDVGPGPTWDAVRYHVRSLWVGLRFGRYPLPEPETSSDYGRPGPVAGFHQRDQTVTVECANGSYVLTVLTPEMIRIRFTPAPRPGRAGATQGRAGKTAAASERLARLLKGVRGDRASRRGLSAQTDVPETGTGSVGTGTGSIRIKGAPECDRPGSGRPFSYAIAEPDDAWPPCQVDLVESEATLELRTARVTCRIARATGKLTFLSAAGAVINEDGAGVGVHPRGPVVCHKRIQPDERFYGLGERTCGLDRRGRRFTTWNSDPAGYELDQDPIYLCIPFLLGLHSGGKQGYGILFDNSFRGWFDLGADEGDVASFGAVGGDLCYTFIYGPALTAVVERYTALTGRLPLPPLWSLGYHQSRWSYTPEARVRRLADDFRRVHDVPCDAIHLDIHTMDGYRCFTWDPERFPDPAGLIADLHAQGFKVVVILDAGIKADPGYAVYRGGVEEGVFCALPNGRLAKGPVWPGDSVFPDFTGPHVRGWWGDWLRTLTEVGIDGIWNDMNEPAVFGFEGSTLPDAVRHDLEGRGGDHAEAHNVYGMQMARATAEGLARLRPGLRPFSITRAGWAGVQRHALSWTADNGSTWDHLWLTLPMVMNLGLSGLAFTGADIGGFHGHPSGELFTRWLQMSVFLPFFRTHSHLHAPDQEPWSWGEPYLGINRRWIEHRYRLLPYLYSAFWKCAQAGVPIARPLLLAFQDDPTTHALDDQFMCGDHLLVAPILEEGATHRSVTLPAGGWYDVWSDELWMGPARVEVEAPLERIPIFARAGGVVPTAPAVRHVGERPLDRLLLHVYPPLPCAEQDARYESVLYEDDGETLAYQEGEFLLTRFILSGEREGERAEGAPLARLHLRRETEGRYRPATGTFEVVIHSVARLPRAATCDGHPVDGMQLDESRPALRLCVGPFKQLVLEWA